MNDVPLPMPDDLKRDGAADLADYARSWYALPDDVVTCRIAPRDALRLLGILPGWVRRAMHAEAEVAQLRAVAREKSQKVLDLEAELERRLKTGATT